MKPKREVVHGQPIIVGKREVVPEAMIWSWHTKEAVIGQPQQVSFKGALIVHARPTALLERFDGHTRRIHIIDRNRRLERLLLIAAVLLPIVLNTAASLLRQARSQEAVRVQETLKN
jgi:hypothetical protein